MSLKFELGSCVRATSKFSECTKCEDICPVDTISFINNIPSFTPSACIDCGACVSICPSDAFSLREFSFIEFFFAFIESKDSVISANENIPSLALLSVENLISLANVKENIVINLSQVEILKDYIISNINEANFILSSYSSREIIISYENSKKVEDEEVSSRREFLSNLSIKEGIKHKAKFDEKVVEDELKTFDIDLSNISKIKDKNITDSRKVLLTTLKRVEKPSSYEILPQEEVSFISQKYIDDSCTNCQICYRVCPTGALSSDAKFSIINFDAVLCIKCHLCHDVCEPNSIKLQNGFEISEFFEPRKRALITFNIKRCNECGNNFTYFEGEQICPRCKIEEEESITLHQNAKNFNF
ncbi:Ferredoxin [hydrothermal vent metagenome]|uniref:Ferredoxin n=1 Tax=hydrothermal vent metagenome TaxID=652676 RepID=A0A1W1EJQ0_9ZZZZ